AVGRLFDGVRRADARADRILAVHAYLGRGLDAVSPLDRFQVDHRSAPVRIALRAGLKACLAPDAARVVDDHRGLVHRSPPASGANPCVASSSSVTLRSRTAQTLYSGIRETGSSARIVQLLAARSSGQ